MTVYLDTDENRIDEIQLGLNEQAIRAAQATVQLAELPPAESIPIEKAKDAAAAIELTARPKFDGRLDPLKATEAPLEAVKRVSALASSNGLTPSKSNTNSIYDLAKAPSNLPAETDELNELLNGAARLGIHKDLLEHELASPQTDDSLIDYLDRSNVEVSENPSYRTAVEVTKPFPNLAREIMQLGLAMEKYHTEEKLGTYKKQGDECKAKIDLLLKLSAQLPKANLETGSYEVKEETKLEINRIAEELRAHGIDIFPGNEVDKEITKEQFASANSLINHHIDVNRTNLQELFTTKISVSIQFLQMMTEVMKKVSDLDDRQKRKAIDGARGG